MKEKMITRTFGTTTVVVSVIDVPSKEISDVTHQFVGKVEESQLIKKCKKALESDRLLVLDIKEVDYKETLYGMPESKFIELAEALPDRVKKGE